MKFGPDYYNEVYETYEIPFNPTRARIMAALCKGRTLDLGSGTCQYSEFLPKDLVALDISKKALKKAPQRTFKMCACAERMPFKDEYFDSSFVSELLEHVDDDLVVLGEIKRILKPGGILIVSVPNVRVDPAESESHQREYTPTSLKKAISLFFSEVYFHAYSKSNAIDENRLVVSGVKN